MPVLRLIQHETWILPEEIGLRFLAVNLELVAAETESVDFDLP